MIRKAGALTALLLLGGCAAAPDLRAVRGADAPARAFLADVPFHPQTEYQCGPAALAMALQASGADVTTAELIPEVFLAGRSGSVQPEMMAASRRHGRISYPIENGLTGLLRELDAGHPVIVLQNLALPFYPIWHYAVAVGYDLGAGHLILHSGTEAGRRIPLGTFDRTWARSGRWALVSLPPGELPATTRAQPAFAAIHAFEQVAGAQAATPAWTAATRAWPDEPTGWFALGNAHYSAGDLAAARKAFTAAVRADAGYAPAWLNLGTLYAEQGDVVSATRAFGSAAAIDGPWQAQARAALARLRTDPPDARPE